MLTRSLSFIFFVLAPILYLAQAPTASWLTTAKSITNSNLAGGIVCDNLGNVFMTTSYYSALSASSQTLNSSGLSDIAVLKYDNSGQLLWLKKIGGSHQDVIGRNVSLDALNNIYLTGTYCSSNFAVGTITLSGANGQQCQLFVTKLNSNGTEQWAKGTAGTATIGGRGLTVDTAGNVYVTGDITGSATIGTLTLTATGQANGFVIKLDNNGNIMWGKVFGGTGEASGNACITDSFGNVYIVGNFTDPLVIGSTTLTSTGNFDSYLLKYDMNGNFLYGRNIGSTDNDYGYSIGIDGNDNLYLAGQFSGPSLTVGTTSLINSANMFSEAYVIRYDKIGNVSWATAFGGAMNETLNHLVTTPDGDCYIAGFYNSDSLQVGTQLLKNSVIQSPKTNEALLLKIDSTGQIQWSETGNCISDQTGYSVAVDPLENIYLNGSFQYCIVYDTLGDNISSSHQYVYLVRLGNNSTVGIAEPTTNPDFQIFPNPATDLLCIKTEGVSKSKLSIRNNLGQIIYDAEKAPNRIEISSYPSGIYFIEISTTNRRLFQKFVKE